MKDFEQERTINYAGYGLFVDEEFGKTLFGPDVKSNVVEKEGYELVVLSWNEFTEVSIEIHLRSVRKCTNRIATTTSQ